MKVQAIAKHRVARNFCAVNVLDGRSLSLGGREVGIHFNSDLPAQEPRINNLHREIFFSVRTRIIIPLSVLPRSVGTHTHTHTHIVRTQKLRYK